VLVLLGNGEIAENHEEDEKVINAEREFEYVTGDEFDATCRPCQKKTSAAKAAARLSHRALASQRLARTHATAAVEDAEVQHQHADREKVEDDPEIDQIIADCGLLLPAQGSAFPGIPQAEGLEHFVAMGFAHGLLNL